MESTYSGPRAPDYLVLLLRSIGGINPYGDHNFRLVRAEHRLTPSGGVWLDWPAGTAMKNRNSGRKAPYRRTIEVRMIKRYGPVEGWVLERWVPAKAYGSRDKWYAPSIIGGTMLVINDQGNLKYVPSQGEYPSRGDYEYAGFAFTNEQLSEASVIPCVQALIRDVEDLPTNPARRVAIRSQVARAAAEAADQAYEQWGMEVVQSMQPAFNAQPMVGYGKKGRHSIHEVAKRLGITSHPGVS